MAVLFSGLPCIEPHLLARECAAANPPIPTDRWLGRAGSFHVPIGREVGRGWVLLRKSALDAIDLAADHALAFSGSDRNHVRTFPRITFLHAECVTPGSSLDANAVYLCEVVDRRHHLARRPIDRAYNLRDPDGETYVDRTTNAGTAWTWQGIVTSLATELGIAPLTLPFTPDGTPEGFSFWAPSWAWDALCDVLERLACEVEYNPELDTFAIVRLGSADATATAAQTALVADRLWDGYSAEAVRGWRPQLIRVVFRRLPLPDEGFSPTFYHEIALTPVAGVQSGGVVQLADDLIAQGDTGEPSNVSALIARATERAADWLRKRSLYERRLIRVYRDFQPPATFVGSTLARATLDDRGGPFATAIQSEPDGKLERWGFGSAREEDEELGAPPTPTVPPPAPAISPTALRAQQVSGAWIAGLTDADCLRVSITKVSGKCAGVALQSIGMTSVDGTLWTSLTNFVGTGSGGSGPVTFSRGTSPPTASIDSSPGWWLGTAGGAHIFAFDSDVLCGGDRVPCQDFIIAEFVCVPCDGTSGTFTTSTLPLTIPGGTTRTVTTTVTAQANALSAVHLCLSVPCAGGLSNLTIFLTAPDGVTTYTLLSEPPDFTAQEGELILIPGEPVDIDDATVSGLYAPDDDFSVHPAIDSEGVWTITVVNSGPCAAVLSCLDLCFGAVASGLSGFNVTAVPSSGAAPLAVSLSIAITGSPTLYSVDWGDASPVDWYASAAGITHTYAAEGGYEAVVRAYSTCGGYVEDSVIITAMPVINCSGTLTTPPASLTLTFAGCTGPFAVLNGQDATVTFASGGWNFGDFGGFFTTDVIMDIVNPGDGGSQPTFRVYFLKNDVDCPIDYPNGVSPADCMAFELENIGTNFCLDNPLCGANCGDLSYTIA